MELVLHYSIAYQQTHFQVLDRNCFSDENGTLSDTFLDRTGDEEAKVAVSENIFG